MKKKGFTLMEILVVITMLGILATIIMSSYLTSLTKGRDSRRKQDLEQVARALELYYFENNRYPTQRPVESLSLPWSQALVNPNLVPTKFYMKQIPADPSNVDTIHYYYKTDSNGTYYQLYSCLENNQDLVYKDYSETNCGTECLDCHYGIASPNTSP